MLNVNGDINIPTGLNAINLGYSGDVSTNYGVNIGNVFNGNAWFTGDVGIGTASPATKLHVSSGAITVDDSWQFQFGTGAITGLNGSSIAGSESLNLYVAGSPRMRIDKNGNVGIGTTPTTDKLTVFNGTTTGAYTTGDWTHSSDARLKHDITPLQNSLDKILKLSGVEYKLVSLLNKLSRSSLKLFVPMKMALNR